MLKVKMNTEESNNQTSFLKKTVTYSFYVLSITTIGIITLLIGIHSALNNDHLFRTAMYIKQRVMPQATLASQNTNEFGRWGRFCVWRYVFRRHVFLRQSKN